MSFSVQLILLSMTISGSTHTLLQMALFHSFDGWVLAHCVYARVHVYMCMAGTEVKKPLGNAGDTGDMVSIHGSGRPPGEGNGNRLQRSCRENSMDRGAWPAAVHGVTKSWTWLSTHTHTCMHTHIYTRHLFYLLLCLWTFKLLPHPGYHK